MKRYATILHCNWCGKENMFEDTDRRFDVDAAQKGWFFVKKEREELHFCSLRCNAGWDGLVDLAR